MNSRKAKAIRRIVRDGRHDPRDASLKSGDTPTYISALMKGPGCMFMGDRVLMPTSGRAIYKSLKKAVRRGMALPQRA